MPTASSIWIAVIEEVANVTGSVALPVTVAATVKQIAHLIASAAVAEGFVIAIAFVAPAVTWIVTETVKQIAYPTDSFVAVTGFAVPALAVTVIVKTIAPQVVSVAPLEVVANSTVFVALAVSWIRTATVMQICHLTLFAAALEEFESVTGLAYLALTAIVIVLVIVSWIENPIASAIESEKQIVRQIAHLTFVATVAVFAAASVSVAVAVTATVTASVTRTVTVTLIVTEILKQVGFPTVDCFAPVPGIVKMHLIQIVRQIVTASGIATENLHISTVATAMQVIFYLLYPEKSFPN